MGKHRFLLSSNFQVTGLKGPKLNLKWLITIALIAWALPVLLSLFPSWVHPTVHPSLACCVPKGCPWTPSRGSCTLGLFVGFVQWGAQPDWKEGREERIGQAGVTVGWLPLTKGHGTYKAALSFLPCSGNALSVPLRPGDGIPTLPRLG